MKILFVSPSFSPAYFYGGPIRSSLEICSALSELGHDVRVLTTNAAGGGRILPVQTEETVWVRGFRVDYARRTLGEDLSLGFCRRMRSLVMWSDVLMVNAVFSPHSMVALGYARFFARPVLWSPRGGLQGGRPGSYVKRSWLVALSVLLPQRLALHFTSGLECRGSNWFAAGGRQCVIGNGVTIPESPVRGRVTGPIRLAYMGRLHPIKDLPLVFEAIAICNRDLGVSVELVLIGGGSHAHCESLRADAVRLGVNDYVAFRGPVDDLESRLRILDDCDLGVLVSQRENFGNSVAEFLAAGLAVLVTENLPWQEVKIRRCGLAVGRSAREIAHAVAAIDRAALREMGAIGREWMRCDYSWRARAKEVVAVLEDLCCSG